MKTSITLSLLLLVLFCNAQKQKKTFTDDIYFSPEPKTVFTGIQNQVHNQTTDLQWLQYNLQQYHRQRQVTFYIGLAAAAVAAGSVATDDKNIQNTLLITSGVISLGGLYSYFKAESYLKKASLPPIQTQ